MLDDRAGNRSQCLGVAEALAVPYEIKDLDYSFWAKLPNGLLGPTFRGLRHECKQGLVAPWPELVISAGRRTAPVAREIKHRSYGMTKLVQIMWPGGAGIDAFDLVCVPHHDAVATCPNVMHITGAPNRIRPEDLTLPNDSVGSHYEGLASPRIALLCGGSTKNRRFTSQMAEELGRLSSDMTEACGGSLLVTTSRRTGPEAVTLQQHTRGAARVHQWNDPGENPYMSYLAVADALIVTGESMSMCSEACSTGKPVFIYAPQDLITEKHQRLHDELYRLGCARPLSAAFDTWSYRPLQTARDIAERIGQMMPRFRDAKRPSNA